MQKDRRSEEMGAPPAALGDRDVRLVGSAGRERAGLSQTPRVTATERKLKVLRTFRPPLAHDDPQKLIGQSIRGVTVVSDDNGVTEIHLLGDEGLAYRIRPGDPGYLDVGEYAGWRIRA